MDKINRKSNVHKSNIIIDLWGIMSSILELQSIEDWRAWHQTATETVVQSRIDLGVHIETIIRERMLIMLNLFSWQTKRGLKCRWRWVGYFQVHVLRPHLPLLPNSTQKTWNYNNSSRIMDVMMAEFSFYAFFSSLFHSFFLWKT